MKKLYISPDQMIVSSDELALARAHIESANGHERLPEIVAAVVSRFTTAYGRPAGQKFQKLLAMRLRECGNDAAANAVEAFGHQSVDTFLERRN